jgi:hypothetical protein
MVAPLLRALRLTLRWSLRLVGALAAALLIHSDVYHPSSVGERVRVYTAGLDFDFLAWTFEAVSVKVRQASVDEQLYLDEAQRAERVRAYFDVRRQLERAQSEIAERFADPGIADPAAATAALRAQEAELRARLEELQPLAEAILQEQVAVIFAEQGLTLGGQPVPPVSFHFTPLPLALVISPRAAIQQTAIQMIDGDLTLEQQVALEERAAQGLDVSTLVTPIGGVGTYPTMVAQSSDLNWIAATTAHEWVHNYLTLRPLGLLYDATPALRTMNETTASLVGDEIGALVMQRYYPDLAPPPRAFENALPRLEPAERPEAAPRFDFRAEMRRTRVQADALLAQGKVEAAEAYMEARRRVFWENGYRIRKLNQAYFAFYGAYAASPGGGAEGADPVGPTVRLLRRRSPSLAEFLNTIAWFSSLEALRTYLGLPAQP